MPKLGLGLSLPNTKLTAVTPAFMPNYLYIVDSTFGAGFLQKYGDSDYRMYKFDYANGQRGNSDEATYLAYSDGVTIIGTDTLFNQWYFAYGSQVPNTLLDYTPEAPNTGSVPTAGWTNGLSVQEYGGPTEISVPALTPYTQYWVGGPFGIGYTSYDPSTQTQEFGNVLSHDGANWVFTTFDNPQGTLTQPFLSGPLGNYTNGITASPIV